jgi:hypothetical protein
MVAAFGSDSERILALLLTSPKHREYFVAPGLVEVR